MALTFSATKAPVPYKGKLGAPFDPVLNRGSAPDSYLEESIAWCKTASDLIFAPNDVPVDIFTCIKSSLATPIGTDASGTQLYHWESLEQRRASVLEAMRVHAGFESSWNFNEGVDTTNPTSESHITGQEAGIFQVSFNSEWLGHDGMKNFAIANGIDTPEKFIAKMKSDHALAFGYYARLARISMAWAGPFLRHGPNSVYPWLRRDARDEFMQRLAA